tara:strand:- start:699 stop:2453 length:1755 start_codon:yes stop_codon:yes gene_type:complete
MKLKLFVDIFNRKLVTSATSDFPVQLPSIFREDHIELEIMLLEPTGNLTNPLSTVDISALSIQVAIGEPDSSPEALQTTFSKDTSTNKFSGTLNINTTEMVAAFNAATGNTIARFLEIEVEGTASQYHTVLQQSVTLSKDIITHPLVSPSSVTTGTAFANSFAATATDSTTVEWTASGDYNYAHLIGMSGLSSLTAGQYVKVNSGGTGFELSTVSVSQALNDHTDVDLTTAAPTANDLLRYDGTNWVPVAHSINSNTDVDTATSAPTTGQILSWNGTNWVPAAAASAGTQNLWATVEGDSGTTTADSTTDTLQIQGGDGIDTAVSGDVLTVSGEAASTTNKGIASFENDDFTVTNGAVSLKSISIANGGTGAANAADGFDNLAPTTTAGDLITHDGSDNTRLAIGTAGQVLKVNSAANGVEWGAASGAGSIDGLTDVDTSSSGHVPADEQVLTWDAGMSHWMPKALPVEIGIAVSDETTALTTGTAKTTFRMPHAMTLTAVRANVSTAPAGANLIVDINEGGTTIFSTNLSIDDGEKTSTTAATPAVISDTALADDAEITVDIDQIGSSTAGAGLKIWLIGTRV